MSEIQTPLIKLEEGKQYIALAGEYLITEKHTIADVVRFLVDQSGVGEVQYIINEIADKKS